MKKYVHLFLITLFFVTGCSVDEFESISAYQPFIASMNIEGRSVTFYDENYALLVDWSFDENYASALLVTF